MRGSGAGRGRERGEEGEGERERPFKTAKGRKRTVVSLCCAAEGERERGGEGGRGSDSGAQGAVHKRPAGARGATGRETPARVPSTIKTATARRKARERARAKRARRASVQQGGRAVRGAGAVLESEAGGRGEGAGGVRRGKETRRRLQTP